MSGENEKVEKKSTALSFVMRRPTPAVGMIQITFRVLKTLLWNSSLVMLSDATSSLVIQYLCLTSKLQSNQCLGWESYAPQA